MAMYRMIDTHTGEQVGKAVAYGRRNVVRAAAERRNQEWGAVRYVCEPVYA